MMKKLIFLFLLCLSISSMAQQKYITITPIDQIDSNTNYSNTKLVPVIFKVNKTKLIVSPKLDSLVNFLSKLQNNRGEYFLDKIWIGGSASPEGSYRGNVRLGYGRAEALKNYLINNRVVDLNKIITYNIKEDWNFLDKLNNSSLLFNNSQKISDIVNNTKNLGLRKQMIKNLDGGRTWHRLIKNVFPDLRNARVVIFGTPNYAYYPLNKLPLMTDKLGYNYPGNLIFMPQNETKEYRFFSVKTNALFLLALTANIGFEYQFARKWSIDVPFYYSPYDIVRPTFKIRLLATQPEIRYWLDKGGEGVFVGMHTHIVGFNIAINNKGRYQDPNYALWGMGVSCGYATHFDKAKRWGIEFGLGLGYAHYKYDVYRNFLNGPKFIQNRDGNYFGITRASIGISYKWYRQVKRR